MVLQQCGRVDSRRFLSPDYQYGSQDFLFVIKSEIRLNLIANSQLTEKQKNPPILKYGKGGVRWKVSII